MRKKIALCGVFDLSNYGDHLFPIAFDMEMKKRGISVDLYLFSVYNCTQGFNEENNVYSIDELEELHLRLKFDAIVVGGGEIILFGIMKQKFKYGECEYLDYNISKIWTTASLISNKHNISLIWNVPGLPFMFYGSLKKIVKSLVDNVDYLSVRNDFSKNVLLDCGYKNDNIKVYPDTGIKVHEYYNSNDLDSVRKSLLETNKKYIVYHSNRFIPEDDKFVVVETLEHYRLKGYEVVLLPLAYTHGDEIICSEINRLAQNKFIEFERKLTMAEIVSILSGCELYVGVSFHGAITAVSFGKKAIAFDFMHNHKTRDLFTLFNLNEYYVVDSIQLKDKIKKCIDSKFEINLTKIVNEIDKHFDNIRDSICNENCKQKTSKELAISLNEFIENTEFDKKNSDNHLESLEKSVNHYKAANEDVHNYVIELEKSVNHYKAANEDVHNYVIELEKSVEYYKVIDSDVKKHVNYLEVNSDRLIKDIEELNYSIKSKNELIWELKLRINRIENSMLWKILKFFRVKY